MQASHLVRRHNLESDDVVFRGVALIIFFKRVRMHCASVAFSLPP